MIKKRKNIIKIAIDSPAAAGAGTVANAISKHYKLFYLDTGKIYRFIAYLKLKNPKKFNKNVTIFSLLHGSFQPSLNLYGMLSQCYQVFVFKKHKNSQKPKNLFTSFFK